MSKDENKRCLELWGCIPIDEVWVKDSKLFQTGNDYATGFVSSEEKRRRENLTLFLAKQGVIFV